MLRVQFFFPEAQNTKKRVSLEELLAPVALENKPPATTLATKILTAHLTSSENLRLMKTKDKFHQAKLEEKKAQVKAKLKNPRRKRSPNEDEPFLFAEQGQPGWECVQCFAEYLDPSVLEEDPNWVVCPKCESPQHYTCIKYCKVCICGIVIRLHRVEKNM